MNASLKIESWPLDKLVHYARNPRKNDAQVDRMVSAIREFGFRIPVVAKSDGTVVDGHLRLKAAAKLGMAEVPVVLADELTDAQVKAFRILANKSANWAEWDTELLTLEIEELQAMAYDVTLTGFDTVELDALLNAPGSGTGSETGGADDETYTRKIVSPIYEPKGERPAVSELYDESKTLALISAIDHAGLPEDVAAFLKAAAQRHTIFNFGRIAEFYAHAGADVQTLMEDSALVIIDFQRAIELGFVRLTERLGEVAEVEGWKDAG